MYFKVQAYTSYWGYKVMDKFHTFLVHHCINKTLVSYITINHFQQSPCSNLITTTNASLSQSVM